jgi:enhancer of polycomb-like protein
MEKIFLKTFSCNQDDVPRKEKRQYKKRKHKADVRSGSLDDAGMRSSSGSSGSRGTRVILESGLDPLASSDEDTLLPTHSQPTLPSDHEDEDTVDEGQFIFRRNRNNNYLSVRTLQFNFKNWPLLYKTYNF